jgi:hypothetical protein
VRRLTAKAESEVVKLRSSPATAEFRDWLWSQPTPADAKAVSEAYLAAMKPGAKLADKPWFKTMRVSTVSAATTAAGAGIGAAVAGVPGMIAGGVVSLAASLFDAFGLERLVRGKNPRRFADEEIRPRVADLIARVPSPTPPNESVPRSPSEAGVGQRASTVTEPDQSSGTVGAAPRPANRKERRAQVAADRRREKKARQARAAQQARERRQRWVGPG